MTVLRHSTTAGDFPKIQDHPQPNTPTSNYAAHDLAADKLQSSRCVCDDQKLHAAPCNTDASSPTNLINPTLSVSDSQYCPTPKAINNAACPATGTPVGYQESYPALYRQTHLQNRSKQRLLPLLFQPASLALFQSFTVLNFGLVDRVLMRSEQGSTTFSCKKWLWHSQSERIVLGWIAAMASADLNFTAATSAIWCQ